MSISDKVGLKFILVAIKGMGKNKLLGTLSICANSKPEDKEVSDKIENAIRYEWIKRKYDLKELETYLSILRSD
jgi:hypothetical protein